ncbi:hypothetical protein [Megasphaera vaginalis (ex Srinivasan et al. 2021)]|uniref:Uncharacterized protein n=1 Tax=Megasphaera vaginalis (ex Srinivasan et al. 2021) TaxID=1111454 RepID=U7UC44_9FIRM|nr:hypothetical protein [Megasphaera vaginalis (ex Srinivasan et al. 2021)]ERT56930.1 hypothetical protein HMPREF1250_0099 [Megasphaera vaginalis (ex Srinivasan et al. 2021)]
MEWIWLVILFIAFSALPDLLRKKRRYKPRQVPTPRPRQDAEKDAAARREGPQPESRRPAPLHVSDEAPAERAGQSPQTEVSAVTAQSQTTAVKTLREVASEQAWSRLTPPHRALYSGLIWSELWQPPVAVRRKRK